MLVMNAGTMCQFTGVTACGERVATLRSVEKLAQEVGRALRVTEALNLNVSQQMPTREKLNSVWCSPCTTM